MDIYEEVQSVKGLPRFVLVQIVERLPFPAGIYPHSDRARGPGCMRGAVRSGAANQDGVLEAQSTKRSHPGRAGLGESLSGCQRSVGGSGRGR